MKFAKYDMFLSVKTAPQKSTLIDFGGSSPVKSRPTAATNGTDQPMLASAQASQEEATASATSDLSLLGK